MFLSFQEENLIPFLHTLVCKRRFTRQSSRKQGLASDAILTLLTKHSFVLVFVRSRLLTSCQEVPGSIFVFAEAGLRKLSIKAAIQEPQKEAVPENQGLRQLLGIKGAGVETNIWKIRLQLTKPVTWVPLIWGGLRF